MTMTMTTSTLVLVLALAMVLTSSLVEADNLFTKTGGKSYACCAGQAYVSTEVACCNNTSVYDPSSTTCCLSGKTSYIASGRLPSCCQYTDSSGLRSVTFNPSTQLCCPGSSGLITIPADPNQVGICCGGKLLAQGVGCCNGLPYNPVNAVCCNNAIIDLRDSDDRCCVFWDSLGLKESKTYDSSKETCCVGNGLDIPGGGGVLKGTGACCGTSFKKAKTYDVTTKLCCGGTLVDKSKADSCCGTKGYNRLEKVCCNGKIYPISKGASCCGNKNYNPSQKTCCAKTSESGSVVPKLFDGVYKCCNGEPIKKKNRVCCSNGFFSEEKDGEACCGAEGYYPSKGQICCSNTITTGDTCCGTNGFNSGKGKVCCGGQIVNGNACCGTQAYDTSDNICCAGVIRSLKFGSSTQCCSDQTYDSSENACCSGIIYNPNQKICCKA